MFCKSNFNIPEITMHSMVNRFLALYITPLILFPLIIQ